MLRHLSEQNIVMQPAQTIANIICLRLAIVALRFRERLQPSRIIHLLMLKLVRNYFEQSVLQISLRNILSTVSFGQIAEQITKVVNHTRPTISPNK